MIVGEIKKNNKMKIFLKLSTIIFLLFSSSCAMMFGEKEAMVSIASQPPGANIIIEGKNYGQTPTTLKLEAKNYSVSLIKEGYGATDIKLESWVTIKNGHCAADALTFWAIIPYYSLLFSGYCAEFKQKEYLANIPYQALRNNQNSVKPINYYDYQSSGYNAQPSQSNYYSNPYQSQQQNIAQPDIERYYKEDLTRRKSR
jgi:hypothetical protein